MKLESLFFHVTVNSTERRQLSWAWEFLLLVLLFLFCRFKTIDWGARLLAAITHTPRGTRRVVCCCCCLLYLLRMFIWQLLLLFSIPRRRHWKTQNETHLISQQRQQQHRNNSSSVEQRTLHLFILWVNCGYQYKCDTALASLEMRFSSVGQNKCHILLAVIQVQSTIQNWFTPADSLIFKPNNTYTYGHINHFTS